MLGKGTTLPLTYRYDNDAPNPAGSLYSHSIVKYFSSHSSDDGLISRGISITSD